MGFAYRARENPVRPALVVDDDAGIVKVVCAILRHEGYFAFSCCNAALALKSFQELNPGLVILDVRMPHVDGLTVCRQIREISSTPIIVLTVMDDQRAAAAALEAGADDYIRKPFGADELRARIRAISRRRGRRGSPGLERIVSGALIIDGERRIVTVNNKELLLTPTEFALLALLARYSGRVLTHQQILRDVWGEEYADASHMLRVTLSRLRHKLEMAGTPLIQTVTRVGYRLVASVDGGA